MKNILLLSILVLLINTAKISAQTYKVESCEDTMAQFTSFTGRYVEGVTYLHWDIVNQHTNGIYTIYRSLDGNNYEVIGRMKGVGVPISIPIAYYFQDKSPHEGTTYYRLVHLSKDKNYLLSDKISVTAGPVILSQLAQ